MAGPRHHGSRNDPLRAGLVAAMVWAALPASPALAADRCAMLPAVTTVVALDEGSRTVQGFEAERDLRSFALYSYRNIAGDLVDGRGPYLDALAHPFRVFCDDHEVLLRWLRVLFEESGCATDYSRRMGVALATMRATAKTNAPATASVHTSKPAIGAMPGRVRLSHLLFRVILHNC